MEQISWVRKDLEALNGPDSSGEILPRALTPNSLPSSIMSESPDDVVAATDRNSHAIASSSPASP